MGDIVFENSLVVKNRVTAGLTAGFVLRSEVPAAAEQREALKDLLEEEFDLAQAVLVPGSLERALC